MTLKGLGKSLNNVIDNKERESKKGEDNDTLRDLKKMF